MYLSWMKSAIFLVLVLSQKFANAYVQNIVDENITPSKILTNLWKVPWMNLNSSWTDKVANTCGDDISTLFRSADDGEMWALTMLDASSKVPAGILNGNYYDLGMYDQCLRVKGHSNPTNIGGQYCSVFLGMPTESIPGGEAVFNAQKISPYNPNANDDLTFSAAVCLPSSCSDDDVRNFVDASIQSNYALSKIGVRVQAQCSSGETADYTLGTILTLSFFAVVITLLAFCTVCDFLITARPDFSSVTMQTLAKFSLYSNAVKLTNTEIIEGTVPAIHGLRFLNMCFVISGHTMAFSVYAPLVNLRDVLQFSDSPLSLIAVVSPYAVDTFFLLNGFLTTYLLFKKLRSGEKFSVFQFYLHRYLRITPCVGVVILVEIFIFPIIASGPAWERMVQMTSSYCEKNWWTNLLFLQNLVNSYEICLPHSWYVAAEMQLFWLSPIILYPLFYRPKLGLSILAALLILSFVTPAVVILNNQIVALYNNTKTLKGMWRELCHGYILPHCRGLPFFVGILCAYCVVEKKRTFTMLQAFRNWTLAGLLLLFCVWNASFVHPVSVGYNPGWEASYVSIGRLAWSLAMAWIVYASTTGSGGPIGRFMSLPVFIPLSRLSFGMYLVSLPFQGALKGAARTAQFHTLLGAIYAVWGDLAVSIGLAFVLYLCFETPATVLEEFLRDKRRAKIE